MERDFRLGRNQCIAGGTRSAPTKPTISICLRFDLLCSSIAERGALNRARVHAKLSRELGQVVGIPGKAKRDRDDACLSETGGRHPVRFSDQGNEFLGRVRTVEAASALPGKRVL